MKSFTERNPLVIGLVAIAVILVGTVGALVLNASFFARLAHNYAINAVFPDTAGLRGGDRVTIAGVQVGTVGGIRQQGNSVRVTLKINHGVQIPDDSSASLHVATLLGRKEVRIATGRDWAHLYRGGGLIPQGRTSSPTEVLDVQSDAQAALAQLDATSFNTLISDLAQLTAGKREEVNTIVDGLNRLTSTIDARHDQVSTLIDAAKTVTSTLASRDDQLVSIIDNLNVVLNGLAQRRAQIGQLLDNAQAAAGQISGLVGTNRTKLDAVLAELHTDLGIIGQHQVDLAQGIAYLASGVQGFQSIGYSGPTDTPNTWANVFTVGLGPASADPVFGCGGAVDAALTAALGPDPASCSQATGPVGATAPAPAAASSPTGAATLPTPIGTPLLPVPSATATGNSLQQLLVPLLAG